MTGISNTFGWFQISEVARQVYLICEPEHVQSYLLVGAKRAALLDTGMGFCDIRPALRATCSNEIVVLNTHWHFDHIGGNAGFTQIGISALEQHKIRPGVPNEALRSYIRSCQQDELPFPDGFQPGAYSIQGSQPSFVLAEGDRVDLGGRALEVIATPGHTHGSLSFLDSCTRSLFCGDLIYNGTLYAHFTDSDLDEYIASLRKLIARRGEFEAIFPAHNLAPLPLAFLDLVLAGLLKIKSGHEPYSVNEDWGQPVRLYDFGDFRVLAKPPGSDGVHLF